ncbi:DUF4091 domain-containing protein [Microlunatus soli]|uniref:Glycoside hydrolase 123 catalytic domain-containing protein n=1 Tax=Microlunatus soli TaxID=630515 RepID=A0A1H1UUS3_9ACTN|nr:DUF4091 domain-containing protein [Microlunatus soli]SDS75629.1 protein of unknown function [Microlunatus soli]
MSEQVQLFRPAGWVLAAFAAVLVISSAGATPRAYGADDIVLGDFESATETHAILRSPSIDRAELAGDFATEGSTAVHFRIGTRTLGESSFGIMQLPSGSALQQADYASRSYLRAAVVNATPEPNTLYLVIRDTSGHYLQKSLPAEPWSVRYFTVPTSQLAASGTDPAQIAHLQFSSERSAAAEDLWIDDIRLTDTDTPESELQDAVAPRLIAAMGLAERLEDARERLATTRSTITGHAGPDRWLLGQGSRFDDQLDAIATRIDGIADDVTQARAVLTDLTALDRRVQRFAGQVDARRADRGSFAGIGWSASTDSVYPRDLRCLCSTEPHPVELGRGESESTQLVTMPYGGGLTDASVSVVSAPSGLTVTSAPVASLDLSDPKIRQIPATPTAERPSTYRGWTPDPILTDRTTVDVAGDDLEAFWIEVRATDRATIGRQRVELELSAAGRPAHRIDLPVTVWDFTVPDTRLKTAIGHDPAAYAEPWGVTDPDQVARLVDQEYAFLAGYRIQPDNIYRKVYQSRPPTVQEIRRWEKLPGGLKQFNVWYFDPRTFTIDQPDTWDADADALFDKIAPSIEAYRKAGLIDKAYLYCCDETRAEYVPMIKHVLGRFKERFGDVKVLTTAIDDRMGLDSGLADLIDEWVRDVPWYDPAVIAERRSRGLESWWYLHAGVYNPAPNVDLNYRPGDLRTLLGPMINKADVDGFLYYRVDRWYGNGKLDDGPLSSWGPLTWNDRAGDGSLFYPGITGPIPSVRLENMKDGLEDYALIDLLKQRADRPGADPQLVARARELIKAEQIVQNAFRYDRTSDHYRAWRHDIASVITRLGT